MTQDQNVMTQFERDYTAKVNMYGLGLLALHLPVLAGVAWALQGSPLLALGIALVLLAGPAMVLLQDRASSRGAIAIAVSAMGMSALAIHVSNGLIEAHFELFVMIALLTVFGRVAPLLVAGTTIALHHVIFWLWLPASVFNYKASFAIVLLHAFFVVLEVIPACWIARQFGNSIRAQSIVAEHLSGAAEQVTTSSAEIGQASSRLAEAACEQAATIEETCAASVAMKDIVVRNGKVTGEALKLMTFMDQELEAANRDVAVMKGVVEELVTSSKKIGAVVGLIDGIAFQTQILSLNAAIEAASAGEYGAGFAVVAQEVGRLAQESAVAATDTGSLIELTLANTRTGEAAVLALGTAMARVNGTADRVKTQIALLQGTSHEQEMSSATIAQAMTELGDAAQATAAGAEETSAAGACLTEQATTLRGIVELLHA
jgi:hypothetical protein